MSHSIPMDIRPAYPQKIPREAVRVKLLELLGLDQIPEHVDFTTDTPEESDDGLRVMRVTFLNSFGEAVPGILSIPLQTQRKRLAGVVCLPGTSGYAERVAAPRFYWQEPHIGPLIGWGRELARRGFATLSLSVKGCAHRGGGSKCWNEEAKGLAPYGRTQMGVLVEEALRGARVLAANEGVDAGRIGLAGMSLGGNAAWYAMACAPWIRTGAPICGGVGSMVRLIHEGHIERHSAYYFIPHLLRYVDHPEIVTTCIAPRPFMIVAPTTDEDMPRSGVDSNS